MQQRCPAAQIDRLADLVAKSLVVVDASGNQPRFRLARHDTGLHDRKTGLKWRARADGRRHAEYYLILINAPKLKRRRDPQPSGSPTTPEK